MTDTLRIEETCSCGARSVVVGSSWPASGTSGRPGAHEVAESWRHGHLHEMPQRTGPGDAPVPEREGAVDALVEHGPPPEVRPIGFWPASDPTRRPDDE